MNNWKPTEFERFESSFSTSTRTARIVTDAGKAYIKALGNPEGPHVLAFEWIAANLARWFGLRTFDFAVIVLKDEDEIFLGDDCRALPGPAFVTKAERGRSWNGSAAELENVQNTEDITRLIVFDNWIRNRDRYFPPRENYDNVFLSTEHTDDDFCELIAMDHTHCMSESNFLSAKISNIDYVKDDRLYCGFPAFMTFFDENVLQNTLSRLSQVNGEMVGAVVNSIPDEWEVEDRAAEALTDFLCQRAVFLSQKETPYFCRMEGE